MEQHEALLNLVPGDVFWDPASQANFFVDQLGEIKRMREELLEAEEGNDDLSDEMHQIDWEELLASSPTIPRPTSPVPSGHSTLTHDSSTGSMWSTPSGAASSLTTPQTPPPTGFWQHMLVWVTTPHIYLEPANPGDIQVPPVSQQYSFRPINPLPPQSDSAQHQYQGPLRPNPLRPLAWDNSQQEYSGGSQNQVPQQQPCTKNFPTLGERIWI